MKILATVFAAIALLAILFGYTTNGPPVFAVLGKTAAVIALAGFIVTAFAYVMDELIPHIGFDADDIHP